MGMLLWVFDDSGDGFVLLVVVSRQVQGRWCKTYVPFWGLGREDELDWDSRWHYLPTPSGAYGKKLGQLD